MSLCRELPQFPPNPAHCTKTWVLDCACNHMDVTFCTQRCEVHAIPLPCMSVQGGCVGACAGVLVMVVLLCLTPVFKNMPQNAQGAVIIAAVIGLFNYSEWWFLWKVRRACGVPYRESLHLQISSLPRDTC